MSVHPPREHWRDAAELEKFWLAHFAPPDRPATSDWAESNIVLPAKTNAQPGPLRLTKYQRGLADALREPGVEIAAFMLASQTGKSLSIDAALLEAIANDPGPMLAVHPTDAKAKEWTRDRIDPLVKSSPAMRGLIGDGKQGGGGDSIAHKSFPGGSLHVASSYKADDLAARSIRYLFADEVDRFAPSAGVEGCPLQLAIKRTRRWRNRKIIISSTPTIAGRSKIKEWYDKGDKRKFQVPCPDCGTFQPLELSSLVYESNKPESARWKCSHCAANLTERQRLAALDKGAWIATAKGEKGIVSFHLTELASNFSSLEDVACQHMNAKTPEQEKTFKNTVLAEVFEPVEAHVDASELSQRAVKIEAPYIDAIEFITAGADVQGDRIEVTFLAHLPNDQFVILDHRILEGDTSADKVWNDLLDTLKDEAFVTVKGRKLRVEITGIDSGNWRDRVYQFVNFATKHRLRVRATKGRGGFDEQIWRDGSPNPVYRLKPLLLGVDVLKLNILRRLSISDRTRAGLHWLPLHLAETDYFEQLASEVLETKYVRGYPKAAFILKSGVRNEALDCLTYAHGVAAYHRATARPAPKEDIGTRAARLQALHNQTDEEERHAYH